MAMQTGVGLSKVIVLLGAGYTGTVLLKNGKLSDLIGELQALVKGLENSTDSANADDPIAAQVRWLAQEVRQLASARQITVVNGSSGRTDVTSLIVPAATLGALGYGYMWWKGFSFSDLMYVTKRNMATAVANLTKHLETVSEALAKTKRHLTQRIEGLDGKMDEQREMSKLIMNEVHEARGDLSKVSTELYSLRRTVYSLEDKMATFEDKQNLTLMGVDYLCQFADGKTTKVPGLSQFVQAQQLVVDYASIGDYDIIATSCTEYRECEQLKVTGKSRGQLPSSDALGLQGLRELAEDLISGKEVRAIADGDSELNGQRTSNLTRTVSAKCSKV